MDILPGLIAAGVYLLIFGRNVRTDTDRIAVAIWAVGLFLVFSGVWHSTGDLSDTCNGRC